eukprot:scaffold244087_cov28-Prasinocladus_malaysianus.AAC.2
MAPSASAPAINRIHYPALLPKCGGMTDMQASAKQPSRNVLGPLVVFYAIAAISVVAKAAQMVKRNRAISP